MTDVPMLDRSIFFTSNQCAIVPNNSRYISHSIINVPAIARSAICINDTCTTDTCTHIRGVIEVSMNTALIKIVYLLTIR